MIKKFIILLFLVVSINFTTQNVGKELLKHNYPIKGVWYHVFVVKFPNGELMVFINDKRLDGKGLIDNISIIDLDTLTRKQLNWDRESVLIDQYKIKLNY